jgi:hypothetical protein
MPSETGHASEFKRSLAEATSKVESIIDAAETTASKIKADAERDAVLYRAQKKSEADAEVTAHAGRIEELTRPLIERIERLRVQAADLSAEVEATATRLRSASGAAPSTPSTSLPVSDPAPAAAEGSDETAGSSNWTDSVPGLLPPTDEPEPAAEPTISAPDPAAVDSGPAPVAYPGTATPAADDPELRDESDPASEDALLRATQLAVSGSTRADIAATLRSEFSLEDVDAVLDGILGPEDR